MGPGNLETEYHLSDGWRARHVLKKEPFIWSWDMFGDGQMIIQLDRDVPWLKRYFTKLLFGSVWTAFT